MPIPDTLRHQIELFRETGHVVIYDPQGFSVPSHVSILMGLGVVPKAYDPLIDLMDVSRLHVHFARLRETITRTVKAMPDHAEYIRQHAAAPPVQ
jgi:tryptophan halogenase